MSESHQIHPDSRVILMAQADVFGGAERSLLALTNWLQSQSIPHHFVTYTDAMNFSSYATHAPLVHVLRPRMKVWNKVTALRRYFRENPSNFKPLASGYQIAQHATMAGARGFHTLLHDTPSLIGESILEAKPRITLYQRITNSILRHGLQSGGRTIVTSDFLRGDCMRYFGVTADIARMGGMVNDAFRIRPVADKLNMLSISRVEDNKRIDWILHSLADLENSESPLSKRVDWSLDIVGKGSKMEPLRQMAATLGIGNRIHFHGFVEDAKLVEIFAHCHLFLMPARQGYGIPAIESLQRGIPVLLHRESGVSDILLDTPWATVIHGGEDSMTPGLQTAIESVLAMRHAASPLPSLPTEASWAERVATLCNWI